MAGDCRTQRSPCHCRKCNFLSLAFSRRSFPLVFPIPATSTSLRLLLVPVILIHRVLPARTLQLYRNHHLRPIDLVVFPKSLEMRRQHLHPQRTIRNPINVGSPLGVRLYLHLSLSLLPLPFHRMQPHLPIPHPLPVAIPHHPKPPTQH